MNRIQSKNRRIETYQINNILLPWFDDESYFQKIGCDGLPLG